MDWLSIIIAVLVFVLPAIFENDKKKKRKKVAREPFPEAVEPEFGQQPVSEPEPEPELEPEQPAPIPEPVPAPAPVIAPARIAPHPQPAVSPRPEEAAAPGKKRRFSARDMVIYSEIMHPKYIERRENQNL